MATGRKTGGRQKGTPNKSTQQVKDRLAALGVDPIEGLATIAKEALENGDRHLALKAMSELANYSEPKRKAVEYTQVEAPMGTREQIEALKAEFEDMFIETQTLCNAIVAVIGQAEFDRLAMEFKETARIEAVNMMRQMDKRSAQARG